VRPRDLIRALPGGVELRDDGRAGLGTLHGYFAVWNQWAEINSAWEGRFMERIAPGAFRRTIAEDRPSIKARYQHGKDAQFGSKPLGRIVELAEDATGARYAVALSDTSFNRDLVAMLRDGTLGASFRFELRAEDRVERPEPSDYNVDAVAERTIREARLFEFGPVSFPAYVGTTAGVRSAAVSLTDHFAGERVTDAPWDGSPGRFTDAQYARSCVYDRGKCGADSAKMPAKRRYSLPIREPSGALNRNAVHSAAGMIGRVTGDCPAALDAAKSKLRSAYREIGEDAPDSVKAAAWALGAERGLTLDAELALRHARLTELAALDAELRTGPARTPEEIFWSRVDQLVGDPRSRREDAEFKAMVDSWGWPK
jgi:HK97 family phage prohead protease